jgi:hypothetical protein
MGPKWTPDRVALRAAGLTSEQLRGEGIGYESVAKIIKGKRPEPEA